MVKNSLIALFLFCVLVAGVDRGAAEDVKIGSYLADVLNGVTFIPDDSSAVVLRVGWVDSAKYRNGLDDLLLVLDRFGQAAADGSIQETSWKAGRAHIRFEWGKVNQNGVVGRITGDGAVRVVLHVGTAWNRQAHFQLRPNGMGAAFSGQSRNLPWHMQTDRKPLARLCSSAEKSEFAQQIVDGISSDSSRGHQAALVFDLMAKDTLRFVAGYGPLADLNTVDSILHKAGAHYSLRRARAGGRWGDFIEPIANQLNNSKVYNYKTGRIAHTVSRGWCRDERRGKIEADGQVLFAWDSFFNGLLACLEDPQGARNTIRAILGYQQENGLVPNMADPRRGVTTDRSQMPVGAMCVWKMHQRYPDRDFLVEVYPKLQRWHAWWFSRRPDTGLPYRDGNQNGLLEFGSESGFFLNAKYEGLDDSPAFDDARMNLHTRTMELDDAGLNALWAMDAEYLACIADELGQARESAGYRQERLEMNERMNRLLWNEKLGIYCDRYWQEGSRIDRKEGEPIPSHCLQTPAGEPGLQGDYFRGVHFDSLKWSTRDVEINMATAHSVFGSKGTYYSIRWQGYLVPEQSGDYIFSLTCNDGGCLWLDNKKIIEDDWQGHQKFVNVSNPVRLQKGKKTAIKIEYFQGGGGSYLHLGWFPAAMQHPDQGLFSERMTPLNFYPLICQAASEKQARSMLKLLCDPHYFWGDYVCPTIARNDPSFSDQQYWRGSIWPPTNYLLWLGLKHYAEPKLLNEFAEKSVRLFMINWLERGVCHENFYADGRGGRDPYYTWGALLCLIGLESVCDVDQDGTFLLNATGVQDVELKNIPFFGKPFAVQLKNGTLRMTSGEKTVARIKSELKRIHFQTR